MSSYKGRIFFGRSGLLVDEVEFSKRYRNVDLWDEDIEKKILEKIKNKAFEQARAIVENAKNRAESIKNKAYEEGYKKGIEKADEEVKKIKEDMANRLTRLIEGAEREKKEILESYKKDILELIYVCVEKITSMVFDEQKKQVIEDIVISCLNEIEASKQIKIFVSEQDYDIILNVVEIAKSKFPDIKKWQIYKKEGLDSGTIEIDTGTTKVEDSFLNRKEKVLEIIKEIYLE